VINKNYQQYYASRLLIFSIKNINEDHHSTKLLIKIMKQCCQNYPSRL